MGVCLLAFCHLFCPSISHLTCPTFVLCHEWLNCRGPNWTCIVITAFIIVFIKARVWKFVLLSPRKKLLYLTAWVSPLTVYFPVAPQTQRAPSRGQRKMVRLADWGRGCSLQRKERRERRRTRSRHCTAATAAGRCSSRWAILPNTRLINASWQVNNVQPTKPPPPLCHSAPLPLPLFPHVFNREYSSLCVIFYIHTSL